MKLVSTLTLFLILCIPIQSVFAEDSPIQRDGFTAEFGLSASSISGPGNDFLDLNPPFTLTNFSFGYHITKEIEIKTLFSAEPGGDEWLISLYGGFRAYILQGKSFYWDAKSDVDLFLQSYFGSTWVGPGGGFTMRFGFGTRIPLTYDNSDTVKVDPCLYLFFTADYRYIDFNSHTGSGYLESAILTAGLGACF